MFPRRDPTGGTRQRPTIGTAPAANGRAITLTLEQFKYGWANALDEKEAKELYDTFHVAGSGIALAQTGNANLNPWTAAKVNAKSPAHGPC